MGFNFDQVDQKAWAQPSVRSAPDILVLRLTKPSKAGKRRFVIKFGQAVAAKFGIDAGDKLTYQFSHQDGEQFVVVSKADGAGYKVAEDASNKTLSIACAIQDGTVEARLLETSVNIIDVYMKQDLSQFAVAVNTIDDKATATPEDIATAADNTSTDDLDGFLEGQPVTDNSATSYEELATQEGFQEEATPEDSGFNG